MKSLFDVNDHFTHDALELEDRLCRAFDPVLKQFLSNGYSVRDIFHVALHAVASLEYQTMLDIMCNQSDSKEKE